MLGALTSLTGGGGLSGSSSTGDQKTTSDYRTTAGNISNGGLTLNEGFSFDINNPIHLMGAGLAFVIVGGFAVKALK